MKGKLVCHCILISALLAGASARTGAAGKTVLKSIAVMEQMRGVKLIEKGELHSKIPPPVPGLGTYAGRVLEISPDGSALGWSEGTPVAKWLQPDSFHRDQPALFTVESLTEGKQPIQVEGMEAAQTLGLSAEGKVIVAMALPFVVSPTIHWHLLAVDRRVGVVIHDLTRFATQVELGPKLEDISVSGPGNLVALGTTTQIQVLEIPSGKSVYASPGIYPRLSPDGKRLAYVNENKLWLHSFADGSTVQLLKGKRVKGIGYWSPDGRFLPVGAWTTVLAFKKRQTILDTTTGEYAVIDKLDEGDDGGYLAWVSAQFLKR
jgi:hypothetical protein